MARVTLGGDRSQLPEHDRKVVELYGDLYDMQRRRSLPQLRRLRHGRNVDHPPLRHLPRQARVRPVQRLRSGQEALAIAGAVPRATGEAC